MVSDLFFDNKKFISVKDAASLTGYSKDYIGQLCRHNKIESRRIGRIWYVCEASILEYKNTPTTFDFTQNFLGKNKISSVGKSGIVATPKTVNSFVRKNVYAKAVKSFHNKLLSTKFNFSKRLVPVSAVIILFISLLSVSSGFNEVSYVPKKIYMASRDITALYADFFFRKIY